MRKRRGERHTGNCNVASIASKGKGGRKGCDLRKEDPALGCRPLRETLGGKVVFRRVGCRCKRVQVHRCSSTWKLRTFWAMCEHRVHGSSSIFESYRIAKLANTGLTVFIIY